MAALVVVTPFASYTCAQRISDPALIASILAGPHRPHVVQVVDDAMGGLETTDHAGSSGLPALVAASDLAAGLPVTMSAALGRLVAARGDAKPLSFVMGVLAADCAAGFAAAPMRGLVTLADWSAATGSPALRRGLPYYLDAAGGLTAAPDRAALVCIAAVGIALSASTLMVDPATPIQL